MNHVKLRKLLYVFRQFGFDPIKLSISIKYTFKYIFSSYRFRRQIKDIKFIYLPTLNDFSANAGSADGHYFWQDLICAKFIYNSAPVNHLDVGSRIDGFISSLLAFREVTLVDIRPLDVEIDGLKYVTGDVQKGLPEYVEVFDSVSSLHSIEHFGLGRYGDTISTEGHEIGLRNISKCVSKNGVLYISFPIGEESVEFNSQRIIDPLWPEKILKDFKLEDFILIPWNGAPKFGLNPTDVNKKIQGQAGLYKFKRIAS